MDDEIWGDSIRLIINGEQSDKTGEVSNGVVVTRFISKEYGESMTFNDVLVLAKENGFKKGIFLLIIENPSNGIIYQYANCYDCEPYWSEYGITIGYA